MKLNMRHSALLGELGLIITAAGLWPLFVFGQPGWPFPSPATPASQRNAQMIVRSQAGYLQNATRTSAISPNWYGKVLEQFEALRGAYGAFKNTLTPRQLEQGANDWAELDAGLDILAEAFGNFQEDVASGRSEQMAFRDMCQTLGKAAGLWLQEFNRDTARLRVGWL